jgi:hypothetical protein
MKKMGFNFRIAHSFENMLVEAGFVDVVVTKFEVPWGAWSKDRRKKAIGLWHLGLCSRSCAPDFMLMFCRTTEARSSWDCYGTVHPITGLDTHPSWGLSH